MFRVRRSIKFFWWYLKEISGENAYDRYLEKHRAAHPGKEPQLATLGIKRLGYNSLVPLYLVGWFVCV